MISSYLDLATLVATEESAGPAGAGLDVAGLDLGLLLALTEEANEVLDGAVELGGLGLANAVVGGGGSHGHGGGDEEGRDESLEELHFDGWKVVEAWSLWFLCWWWFLGAL